MWRGAGEGLWGQESHGESRMRLQQLCVGPGLFLRSLRLGWKLLLQETPALRVGKATSVFPGQQSLSCCAYNTTDPPAQGLPWGSASSRRTRGSLLSMGSEAEAGGTLIILSPCRSLEQSLGSQRRHSIRTFQTGAPGRALLRGSLV